MGAHTEPISHLMIWIKLKFPQPYMYTTVHGAFTGEGGGSWLMTEHCQHIYYTWKHRSAPPPAALLILFIRAGGKTLIIAGLAVMWGGWQCAQQIIPALSPSSRPLGGQGFLIWGSCQGCQDAEAFVDVHSASLRRKTLIEVFGGGPLIEVFGGGLWWRSLVEVLWLRSLVEVFGGSRWQWPWSWWAVLRIRITMIRIQIQDLKNSLRNCLLTELWNGSGSRQKRYGSGSQQKRVQYQENRSFSMLCVFILLNNHLYKNSHLN